MKNYRLELKVKNNYILSVMEARGYDTAASLSRASGLSQAAISEIINLKIPAFTKTGNISPSVKRLCDFLSCEPEDIFPEDHLLETLPVNKFIAEVNAEDIAPQYFIDGQKNPESLVEEEDRAGLVYGAVSTLTEREQTVINMLFGLGGEREHTLIEVGDRLGVGKEGVRKIKFKALQKLGARRIGERNTNPKIKDMVSKFKEGLL